jgi:KaiC/GvpD/RAD55 family RecA-like ATPase
MPEVLRFGIASLDELLGIPSEKARAKVPPGIYLPKPAHQTKQNAQEETSFTTSVCIIGPTGTGKSIFALHMASTYVSDCAKEKKIELPTVLYISTDLTYKMAYRAWTNFALDYPLSRCDPFHSRKLEEPKDPIQLIECHPTGIAENFEIINEKKGHVLFVDMAAYTAGDDWGFLHKLLSLLPMPQDNAATPSPRHLVVLDAIEGFEALAGDVNAFGEKSTRRSRIAQVMRLGAGKCHLLLVVEQAKAMAKLETLGEEFVADTVIRLESMSTRNYERRVLKVEKCRGQSHIRGQHHYSIRSGIGSTTGQQTNPDDPRVPALNTANGTRGLAPTDKTEATQSYVQVFHSVHRISRKIMEDKTHEVEAATTPPTSYYAAFGIEYLDNMLGGKTETTERNYDEQSRFLYDTRGLPCSSTTALIGDSLTQKSTLGKAFMSRCFYSFPRQLWDGCNSLGNAKSKPKKAQKLAAQITRKIHLISGLSTQISEEEENQFRGLLLDGDLNELVEELEKIVGENSIVPDRKSHSLAFLKTNLASWLLGYPGGVAIMLVTYNADVDILATEFLRWLHAEEELKTLDSPDCMEGYRQALTNYIRAGTICRRLEIHNLSSEILVHIVRQAIYAAQRKIMTPGEMEPRARRYQRSWPIRVVIDDFSALRSIFPELREDPLLFPSLLFHLEREGVTTLIIDTQAGKPETALVERFETEFRQMVHHRLYTWRVPFYGESRVAIAAIPPLSHEYAGIVRELRWETGEIREHGDPATVDPHFELYSGLEEGNPQPVPLHVRFYAESSAMEEYVEMENRFLSEMFTAYRYRENIESPRIIVGMPPTAYADLRDVAYLQRDTRLDYTFIFQVDEFWSMRAPGRHKRAGAFHPQLSYLDAITATSTNTNSASTGSSTIRVEDYKPAVHADPYQLFTLRKQDDPPSLYSGQTSLVLRRRHFFETYFEDFKEREIFESPDKEQYRIDRVPFSWDFAFLLCHEKDWKDNVRPFSVVHADGQKQELKVRQIWRSLVKAEYDDPTQPVKSESPTDTDKEPQLNYVSWRVFTEACKKAAEEQSDKLAKPVIAFDFAQLSPESFSSLMLELWLSEIFDSLARDEKTGAKRPDEIKNARDQLLTVTTRQLFIPLVESQRKPEALTLLDLVEKYWLELYKSWLLVIELIDLYDIIGDAPVSSFELKSKNTDFSAIASRHWYKTASQCPDEIAVKEPLVAVRLPGHFSVRGDWFLAVAGGSRSIRQAERALDLLNSRRANVTRLQMGVGLPTRLPRLTGVHEPAHRSLYTKLISHERGQHNLEYDTLLKIAANREQEFHWIFRSSMEDYAESNRIWHRWLNYTLLWWHRKLLRYRSSWRNTFEVHDALSRRSYTQREFADQDALNAVQEKLGRAVPDARPAILDKFLKKYPAAYSLAQLRVRLDYLKLWKFLIDELRRVPTAAEQIKSGIS